jgi:hypothetical protein
MITLRYGLLIVALTNSWATFSVPNRLTSQISLIRFGLRVFEPVQVHDAMAHDECAVKQNAKVKFFANVAPERSDDGSCVFRAVPYRFSD